MKNIFSILLLLVVVNCKAQHEHKDKYIPMITHYVGGSFQKFDGLNGRVGGLPQYASLKQYAATLGLGWLKEHNRMLSAGGVTIGSSMSGHHDEKSSTIRYFSLNADIGYDLLKSSRIMLYPLAGVGFEKFQAIFYKDNTEVAFDDVLESSTVQNSIRSVRFNNSFFVYKLGFGFALRSPKNPSNTIGLQAGYTGSFKKKDWKSSENQALSNAPSDRISQFFVGLVLMGKPMGMH